MHKTTWMLGSIVLSLVTAASAEPAATTQPENSLRARSASEGPHAAAPSASEGVVKGNNVYVRSGYDATYYAVTKLNHGDSVKIVSELYGWLEIEPPAGTFSLVDKTYVDRVGDKKGVINGSAQVYAGSNIDPRHYAKQVKLTKGQEVQVLGESSDGAFCKIEPPAGSHVWIKADLIDRGGGFAKAASPKAPTIEPVRPGNLKLTDTVRETKHTNHTVAASSERTSTAPAMADLGKFQLQIDAIEAEITAESAKPLGERVFEPIIAKLQPIADQTEDEISQIYAKTRIGQLHGHSEMASALKDIRDLRQTAIDGADELAKQREGIRARNAMPIDEIVVRGEIRVSSVYSDIPNRPKRWRIVDPESGRTMAYLETAEGSPIDPAQYYGKYVGIKASGHRQLKGTIPPVPIYTVKEIVLQDPVQSKNAFKTDASASPIPLVVSPPSSQPASTVEKPAEPEKPSEPTEKTDK